MRLISVLFRLIWLSCKHSAQLANSVTAVVDKSSLSARLNPMWSQHFPPYAADYSGITCKRPKRIRTHNTRKLKERGNASFYISPLSVTSSQTLNDLNDLWVFSEITELWLMVGIEKEILWFIYLFILPRMSELHEFAKWFLKMN